MRRLLGEPNGLRAVGLFGPDADLNASACAGLACALALRGGTVCLIDEAPGPHNAAGQLGLTPSLGLAELAQTGTGLSDAYAVLPDGPALLRADSALERVATADDRHWNRLADDFAAGAWEWLLLAAPADERPSLALAATTHVLVLPAEKIRLTEAYAVLKAAHHRQPDAAWLMLCMNAGDDDHADRLMASLADAGRRFLGLEVGRLGAVPKDATLAVAARSMRPLHQFAAAAPAATAFRQLAERLHDAVAPAGMSAKLFWQRLGLFGRLNRSPRQHNTRHVQYGRAYG